MTTALIDADIVAYKLSAAAEQTYDFGPGGILNTLDDFTEVAAEADRVVGQLCDAVKADRVIICLTDTVNFRKQLEPTYKSNRKNVVPPEHLKLTKEYLGSEYPSYIRARLEADDVMGILATHPTIVKDDCVIVSEDKDMRTIPAKVYNPNKSQLGVLKINKLDADRFHLWQTICGDQTDGYKGCPGIGPSSVYAQEIIFADRKDLWDIVVDAYASKGFTEDDAILQARMARILRASDYNFAARKIRLWNPTFLNY